MAGFQVQCLCPYGPWLCSRICRKASSGVRTLEEVITATQRPKNANHRGLSAKQAVRSRYASSGRSAQQGTGHGSQFRIPVSFLATQPDVLPR
jgi:hypothetical protein